MTTKKRAPSSSSSSSIRYQLCVGFQLIVTLSILVCILTFLRIQSRDQLPLNFDDDDVDVVQRRSFDSVRIPKIAFLFLARANLPLDFLWHAFFSYGDANMFSIYVHSKPGFVFDKSTSSSHFFYGTQINKSVRVGWGESSMIAAERLLLAEALKDPENQRFVLLSESCVPLHNFSYTYNYLMSSSKSFVDSFLDKKDRKKETRYNPKMSPTIPEVIWRKGSQWITLVRKHAVLVVADNVIFPVFKRQCKRRPDLHYEEKHNILLLGSRISSQKAVVQKEHNCIPDEHYVQTLLSMSGLEHELERRTLTFTSWNQSKKDRERWHPITFEYANSSPQQIKEVQSINHVDYAIEFRTEWCQCNSTFVPCFLFARKFSRGAAMRLLTEGFAGPFDAVSLLLRNFL